MNDYAKRLMDMQTEVDDIEELHQKIFEASTLKQINEIRMACVKLMKKDKSILKKWQKKFWSLKNCPACGKTRPGLV